MCIYIAMARLHFCFVLHILLVQMCRDDGEITLSAVNVYTQGGYGQKHATLVTDSSVRNIVVSCGNYMGGYQTTHCALQSNPMQPQ